MTALHSVRKRERQSFQLIVRTFSNNQFGQLYDKL